MFQSSLITGIPILFILFGIRSAVGGRWLTVDTDCGGDDAMAITILGRAEDLGLLRPYGDLHSFTTVTGNTGAYNASRNVHAILSLIGKGNVPIYLGSENGLSSHVQPTGWFGADGLGDFLPPAPAPPPTTSCPASNHIVDLVQNNPGEVTLVCIGPLTNLALALHLYPALVSQAAHIYILGGCYQGAGNLGIPGVEANMYSDPDGAAYFFRHALPEKVTLLPIETLDRISFPMEWRRNTLGKVNGDIIRFLNEGEREALVKDGAAWPSYDPTLASILVRPELVRETLPARVRVVTQTSEGYRGAMHADLESDAPNVRLVTAVDQDGLARLLLAFLAS